MQKNEVMLWYGMGKGIELVGLEEQKSLGRTLAGRRILRET